MITWDESKRKKVIRDHGIDFKLIEDVFDDPFAIQYDDAEHSASENRWIVIGRSVGYGLISLVYTFPWRRYSLHYRSSGRKMDVKSI